jgi:hypothetical protein
MKPKYLLFASPLIIFLELFFFSYVVEFLRGESDTEVLIGGIMSIPFIVGNYYLVKYLISIINNLKSKK